MTQEQKEKVAKQYAWAHSTLGIDKETFQSEDTHMIPACQMVRVPIYNTMETAVLFGLNYAEKNLWKPADGDDLPEYNREEVLENLWHDASEAPNGKEYVIAWDGKYASIAHYNNVVNCKWCYLSDILPNKEESV